MLKGQVLESHPDTPYSRLPSTESDRRGTHTSSWKAGGPQLRLTALPRGSLKPRAGGNLKETPEGAQWPRQDLCTWLSTESTPGEEQGLNYKCTIACAATRSRLRSSSEPEKGSPGCGLPHAASFPGARPLPLRLSLRVSGQASPGFGGMTEGPVVLSLLESLRRCGFQCS